MKRILITGGAGFVGSSLALRLRKEHPDLDVIALDSMYRRGSELNAERLEKCGVNVVRGDVRESDWGIEPCDLLIDAAAEPSVLAGRRGDDVRFVLDTNLGGTINGLEAARKWDAAFLFLSTSRVYPIELLKRIALIEGETRFEICSQQELPGISEDGVSETFPLNGPRTLYGATKYASEVLVQEYAAQFGIRCRINRCGVIAGPWQMGRVDQGIVALWAAAHVYGFDLKYMGHGGKQVRDVLHIEDFVDLAISQLTDLDTWSGEIFNIGGGRAVSVSLLELTSLCQSCTGHTLSISHELREREGDVPLYVTDSNRISRGYGWAPSRSIGDVVDDTVGWIRDHAEILMPVLGKD